MLYIANFTQKSPLSKTDLMTKYELRNKHLDARKVQNVFTLKNPISIRFLFVIVHL